MTFPFLLCATLFVHAQSHRLLGGLLLLGLGQRLLQNLQNLLVFNLLVALDLFQVDGRGSAETGEAVLGNGWACQSSGSDDETSITHQQW